MLDEVSETTKEQLNKTLYVNFIRTQSGNADCYSEICMGHDTMEQVIECQEIQRNHLLKHGDTFPKGVRAYQIIVKMSGEALCEELLP